MSNSQKRDLYSIIITAILFASAMIIPIDGIYRLIAFAVPYLIIAYPVLKSAAVNISHGQIFDENFLMAIASLGAFALSEYPEAVAVMLFYRVGELFESYAVDRSRKSIADLMDIRPEYANIEQGDGLAQVAPESVAPGTTVVIKPGERVPLDGIILSGSTQLNTAALTGESMPRDAREGDEVLSGTVNLTGVIRVRTTRTYGESTVERILELVENASDKKAATESFITKFARYYTPVVVISAVLLAALPPLIMREPFSIWIGRALTFLVISCPCALVISVPLSFFGGIGAASKHGILVKGGHCLESLAKLSTLVCDKTGTLTEGSFSVTSINPVSCTKQELIELAALGECFTSHPIAQSLRDAYGKPIEEQRVSGVSEISGRGLSVSVDGAPLLIGNAQLMTDNGIDPASPNTPGTVVHVARSGEYMGNIVIADRLKPGASEAIGELRALGVNKIMMLTGDNESTARHIAAELKLDDVKWGLMPQDKVTTVESLLNGTGTTAFVGDGINDAPVLARADLGIAMGALGSDAAIEAADIVLMNDKLSGLGQAIRIGRSTVQIARQNIVFALSIKAVILILGSLGIANMWAAVFADVGVSIIAIMNAMRTLRK